MTTYCYNSSEIFLKWWKNLRLKIRKNTRSLNCVIKITKFFFISALFYMSMNRGFFNKLVIIFYCCRKIWCFRSFILIDFTSVFS